MNEPTSNWRPRLAGRVALSLVLIGSMAALVAAADPQFTILHSFSGPDANGPTAGLILDSVGNLYGRGRGSLNGGGGTIFSVGVDGTNFRLLHSLDGGLNVSLGLVLGPDGSLYGSTETGGSGGGGTIFNVKTDGTEFTVLHSFALGANEASSPIGTLSFDADGNLYGATYFGGANNAGTIFTSRADGSDFRLLYSFVGSAADAILGVILDANGNLYGAALRGGITGCTGGCGTLFTLKTDGTGFSVLYSFSATDTDGVGPKAGGLLVANGVLYGITTGGGVGIGSVFSINTDGTEFRMLHSFSGPDGDGPLGPLVLDPGGYLYGATEGGGPNDLGTVFRVKTDGTAFSILHSFSLASTDGALPFAGVILDGNANVYGTTYEGGASGMGTVFKLTLSPRAGVSAIPLPAPARPAIVTGR